MKVLVTGATGFIGLTLVRALVRSGYDVRALSRSGDVPDTLRGLNIEIHKGDLTVPASLKGIAESVGAVCHLAGVLGETCPDEEYYYRLHVQGTANLLAECANRPIEKFVHCSTTGVLGPTGGEIADESYPYRPSNVYEATKAEGEKLILRCARERRLAAIVLRPGMVYGPGDMHHLGLYRAIKKGYFFLINRGKSYLDPVFVEDVAQAFVKALQSTDSAGQVYMIAGPRPVTVRELAQTIANTLERPPNFLNLSVWMAMSLAKSLSYLSRLVPFNPSLTPSRVKFLTESRACSISKAQERLGYEPISLDKGIARTVAWYKAHGYL